MSALDDPAALGFHCHRAESSDPSVPEPIKAENTGKMSAALYESTQGDDVVTPENFLDALAKKLGDDKDPADSPAKHAKSVKRHNWVMALMALLLGPGGALAVIYHTSDRSKANSVDVEQLKALEPRVEKTEADIRSIKSSMTTMAKSSKEIASGIKELKQENLTKLKNELEDTKRELRRERQR